MEGGGNGVEAVAKEGWEAARVRKYAGGYKSAAIKLC